MQTSSLKKQLLWGQKTALWAQKALIADMTTDPVFMKQAGQYYWYHNDQLGTPQVMTTSSGAVAWNAKYSSFGKATVEPSSTIVNPLRLPGQYEDAETGLHYNYHRYYDPSLGRYLRADPIGLAGGINLFAYTASNPINAIDPLGLDFGIISGPLGAGAFGAAFGIMATHYASQAEVDISDNSEFNENLAAAALSVFSGGSIDVTTLLMAKRSKSSQKKRATDIPSWVTNYPRGPNESCADYAARILEEKYGCGSQKATKRGPGSEYSKIKKNGERGNL